MEIKLTFEEEGFDGHVMMRVATNIDRLELMEKLGLNVMDMAKEDGEKAAASLNNMKSLIRLIKESRKYYKEVELVLDGKEFKSFDDLNDDTKCQSVLMACAMKALLGLGEDGKK